MNQAKISTYLLKRKANLLITLAFIAYTLNGFFHNPAIVTGDAMVWILWGMVVYSYKSYKIKTNGKKRLSFNIRNHTCL